MIIYTDGSTNPNPGPGGYGVVILDDNKNYLSCYSHYEDNTTNNEQEIKAILYSFIMYGTKDENNMSLIYTDSMYCYNIFTNWMFGWARAGWKKSDNQPIKNLELIKAFYDRWQEGYRIEFQWTKGHANNKWNNLADLLAGNKITKEEITQYVNSK